MNNQIQFNELIARIQKETQDIYKQFEKEKGIITTVGVYPDGSYKSNGVSPRHLEAHINYNLTYRVGRALVINNVIVYEGSVNKEVLEDTLVKLKNLKHKSDTAPYI